MKNFRLLSLSFCLLASVSSSWASTFEVTHYREAALQSSLLNRGGGLFSIRRFGRKDVSAKALEPVSVPSGGNASISNEIFNLVKGIVGVAILSLPAAIASFGDSPSALFPALVLIAVMGMMSSYGFSVIGKICSYTGARSYREAWMYSVGEETSWIPAYSATLKTFLSCLSYSMVLADTFGMLLGTSDQRTATLVGMTVLILTPLCWMKNLSSLAPFSLVGVLGMTYTAVAMGIRYFDGSYDIKSLMNSQSLLGSVAEPLHPKFGNAGWESVFQANALILLCTLSSAYMAHFNAPKFYVELKDNTLPRFYTVTFTSFFISVVITAFTASVGFLTFGRGASGLILNNYSSKDKLIYASRVAVAVSTIFSYPLAFQGCRDGLLDLLKVASEKRKENKTLNLMTILVLVVVTILAATLKNVGIVLALGGATLGNALTFVFPALMHRSIVKKQDRTDEGALVMLSTVAGLVGVAMGAIGAKKALGK